MQRTIALPGRTSGAGPASRRTAAGNATSTAATSTPLLARSLTPTRAGANAAAPPRRRLLAPPPRASFLDGLLQSDNKKKTTSSFRPPGAAVALVDALLEAVEGSDAGAADKTSDSQREEIARLAAALKRYRMRSPAQSELLWGKYRVSYCSNPNAAGGPVLRSGPGRALAQAQAPEQELVRGDGPDGKKGGKIRNRVEFSALGLLPRSSAAQEGPLTVTGADTYRVVLERATRDFEVLYLDSRVRVAEFVPSDGRERQLFVFERIVEEGEEEEEEQDFVVEEEEAEEEEGDGEEGGSSSRSFSAAAPSSLFGDFGSFFVKPAESLATVVEREERASGGGGGGGGGGARRQRASGGGNKATVAKAKKSSPSPAAPSFSAPDPAALFEGFISKVTGEDKDSELVRSLRKELAAAAAEAREAERLEKAARSAAAPILKSTAREREELEGAREAAEQAAARARRLAEEAEERAEELARAVAKAK